MVSEKILNKTPQNIFVSLLEELKVKHTKSFSNKYYREHPHRNNLYGLSVMLSDYNIENAGVRVSKEKDTLLDLEAPFIAELGGDFVVVTSVTPDEVTFVWSDRQIIQPIDTFLDSWTGVVLLAEANEQSNEPFYTQNRKEYIIDYAKKGLLLVSIAVLALIGGYYTKVYIDIGLIVSLLVNLIGIYISYLLLSKQIHYQGSYADKICSLFLKGDCNNVLESEASKLFGLFSWSEIGMAYFGANALIILFLNQLYSYVVLINICALPFTIWSIWYQKKVAKEWCVLCLIVQALIWGIFITNLCFGFITIPVFNGEEMVAVGCLYAIPLFILNIYLPRVSDGTKIQQTTQEINNIKANEAVFASLIKEKRKHKVEKSQSVIKWGDPEAKNMLTVLTNPHCNPCKKMHKRLKDLLDKSGNGFCIQYILSSFDERLDDSCKLYIAVYKNLGVNGFLDFLDEWYTGKIDDDFKQAYISRFDDDLMYEYRKHKEWLNETKLIATPTILFNGYELPDKYKVEDLRYFTDTTIY